MINEAHVFENELHLFFTRLIELLRAQSNGDKQVAKECLEEIEAIWLHSDSAKLRQWCSRVMDDCLYPH